MHSTQVRTRGKIQREEWPKISARFQNGETLTQIARTYDCTPPAIRYIVGRTLGSGSTKSKRRRASPAESPTNERLTGSEGSQSAQQREFRNAARDPNRRRSTGNEIWQRINNDVATFLTAMDALFVHETDQNYEELLRATDRLLWASARTRLDLERILATRRSGSERRRALA